MMTAFFGIIRSGQIVVVVVEGVVDREGRVGTK